MSVSSVTFDEILAAAHIRSASLVPETSGYLALAIADASARLPFRLDDTMVHLSSEGTVKVARGTDVVDPEESAAIVRDMLARLLGRSIGSMPGLNNAARPRNEAPEGVEVVIADIEAALVPVNRAAARRALGRLAREVTKARDAGKLRRRGPRERPQAPRSAAPPPAPPQRARRTIEEPFVEKPTAPRDPIPEAISVEVSFSEVPPQVEAVPEARSFVDEFHGAPVIHEPTPTEMGSSMLDVAEPTCIDSVAVVLEQSRIAAHAPHPITVEAQRDEEEERDLRRERRAQKKRETIPGEARFEAADKRSVDDLLASFSVSSYDSDASLRTTRASLKKLAGLDLTPPPPPMAMRGVTPPPPRARESEAADLQLMSFATPKATFRSAHVVLVVAGLLIAGLLGHYVPTWLDRTGAAEAAPKDAAAAVSQRN